MLLKLQKLLFYLWMTIPLKLILILAITITVMVFAIEAFVLLMAFGFVFIIYMIVTYGDPYLLCFLMVFNMSTACLMLQDIRSTATWLFFFSITFYLFHASAFLMEDGNELLNLVVLLILILISNIVIDMLVLNKLRLFALVGGLSAATSIVAHEKRFTLLFTNQTLPKTN